MQLVGSQFRLQLPSPSTGDEKRDSWANEVTLRNLMNHTALPMPYVYGIPLTEKQPTTLELLTGYDDFANVNITSSNVCLVLPLLLLRSARDKIQLRARVCIKETKF